MYDAIVVGARCGGSPTAMLLARHGYRVLLVDQATFPSDTVSTHFIWPPGLACLKQWGLMERVLASNSPAFRTIGLDLGDYVLTGDMPPTDGVAEMSAPRRIVPDKLLRDAVIGGGRRDTRKHDSHGTELCRSPRDRHPVPREKRYGIYRASAHSDEALERALSSVVAGLAPLVGLRPPCSTRPAATLSS